MVTGIGAYSAYNYSPIEYRVSDETKISDQQLRAMKRSGAVECQECANRKYVDGSNETDVSFKAPGHISPQSSAATVMAHEQEHVSNAYTKAAEKGGKVVYASVALHTAICPECGRSYVSGGVTNTQIKYANEQNPYQQERKAADAAALSGMNIDYTV